MLGRFYVAHEVVLRKRFTKFAYASNSISCHFANYYYVSKKCVLLQRDKDGNYMYANNRNKCKVIDPNDLTVMVNILGCNQCDRNNKNECDLKSDAPDELFGVVDIQPIEAFTRETNLSLAIMLVKEYNDSIDPEDEYVYVDDLKYVDRIRDIDDGIGRRRIKKMEFKKSETYDE